MYESTLRTYLCERAFHFLSIRPRSEQEVRVRLEKLAKKHKVSNSIAIINSIIEQLKKGKFIDDAAFAVWLIESRMRKSHHGKLLLEKELRNLGVSKDIVEESLQNQSLSSQKHQAIQAMEKKLSYFSTLSVKDFKVKSFAYLLRKGFVTEVIYAVIDEIIEKKYNKQ